MLVNEVMTKECKTCDSSDTVAKAAQLMAFDNIGLVPVAQDDKLIGVVTDRDIVIRGVSTGADLQNTPVKDVMSDKVYYCFDDQTVDDVAENMANMQIRRLPVVDREKRLVGIVSLGDLASRGAPAKAKKALEGVSEER